MKITDFTENEKVDVPAVEEAAIRINHAGRVSEDDLARIRKLLGKNDLAQRFVRHFQDFANAILTSAEKRLVGDWHPITPLSRAFAEVDYGGQTFLFQRV